MTKKPYNATCGICGAYREFATAQELMRDSFKHQKAHMVENTLKVENDNFISKREVKEAINESTCCRACAEQILTRLKLRNAKGAEQ